ncbi:MAG: DUF4440 domain-containing protein, partial [Planctomycetales bacterium]
AGRRDPRRKYTMTPQDASARNANAETEAELLRLSQQLLDSIAEADWETYQELCDPGLTAFEPEALGQLVEGMDFHLFYFQRESSPGRDGDRGENHCNVTICSPKVQMFGDVAVVTYVRLNQSFDRVGRPVTSAFEETRVWNRRDGRWRHVHFHRSALRSTFRGK